MRLASNLSAVKQFEGRFEGVASSLASNPGAVKQFEGRFEGGASNLAAILYGELYFCYLPLLNVKLLRHDQVQDDIT